MRHRLCSASGCRTAIPLNQSRCDAHKSRGPDTRRNRLYDHKWRAARAAYLRANPLCVRCSVAGVLNLAEIVDHVIPHKGNVKVFWNVLNWQSLCKVCHDKKTAKEDGGFGRQEDKRDYA